MNTITLSETTLTIEPQGLNKMWSFTKRLEIPLTHVRGATWDPGANHENKGLRGPGLGLRGKWSGTFSQNGDKHFWNVSNPTDTVVIELADEHFTRLFLTAANPRQLVDRIHAAMNGV